jgi:hypothetical protein
MKRTLFPLSGFLVVILASAFVGLRAEDKPPTAFETLKQARKLLGDPVGKQVVSMESENAKLRPRLWWIRYYDEALFLKIRAVQIVGPEILQNVEPGNPFDGGDKRYIMPEKDLKVDSEKCIVFMEKAARENGIPLYSLNAKLFKPYPSETSPIWFFEWFDEKGDKLGKMKISATTGDILEIVGLKLKGKKYASISKRTVSQVVTETFSGGDEEESDSKAKEKKE